MKTMQIFELTIKLIIEPGMELEEEARDEVFYGAEQAVRDFVKNVDNIRRVDLVDWREIDAD